MEGNFLNALTVQGWMTKGTTLPKKMFLIRVIVMYVFTPSSHVLFARFLTGPTNLKDPEAKLRFPKIFVSAEEGYEELHLIVYKVSWD